MLVALIFFFVTLKRDTVDSWQRLLEPLHSLLQVDTTGIWNLTSDLKEEAVVIFRDQLEVSSIDCK